MTAGQRESAKRFDHLDGLRGVAALLVVVHHGMTLLDFGLYSGDPAQSLFGWEPRVSRLPFILLNSGSFAVCIFFVLSGFVLANSFSRTALSGPALAVKRYVRLTVPILCANLLAFAVFFMVPHFPLPGADSLLHSAANFGRGLWFATVEALVKATVLGVDPLTYNGVLWTMNIEFIGSMILILLFVSARRLGRTASARLLAATLLAVGVAALTWQSYLGLFPVGALLFLAAQRGVLRPPARWPALLAALVAALFLGTLPLGRAHILLYDPLLFLFGGTFESMARLSLYHPVLRLFGARDWVPLPIGPFVLWQGLGAALLLGCVCCSATLQRWLSGRLCRWLGRVSFALYLVHPMVRETVARWLFAWLGSAGIGAAAAVPLTIAGYAATALLVAQVFTMLIERRSIAWSDLAGRWLDLAWSRWRARRGGDPTEPLPLARAAPMLDT